MSQQVDGNYGSYIASAALKPGVLVKISTLATRAIAAAALGDEYIGSLINECFAAGDEATVKLRSGAGTHKLRSSGAFTAPVIVYGRASGKVDDISTTSAVRAGMAIESAGGADELVEVIMA